MYSLLLLNMLFRHREREVTIQGTHFFSAVSHHFAFCLRSPLTSCVLFQTTGAKETSSSSTKEMSTKEMSVLYVYMYAYIYVCISVSIYVYIYI